ncbi:unnamed protein product [Moneuplotes crassus]|uniref:Uncharacterized protein n=1 Tax=Euplotes crassus TaxID=5936 RepID=A0AAD1Y9K4_EUPCR|nr:unnamed protein product [Moneuplotes crassus]
MSGACLHLSKYSENMAIIQELVFIKACTNAGVGSEEFEESKSTRTSFFPDREKTQQQGTDWTELSQLFNKGDLEESDFRRFEKLASPISHLILKNLCQNLYQKMTLRLKIRKNLPNHHRKCQMNLG